MGSLSVWHWLVVLFVLGFWALIIWVVSSGPRAEKRLGTGITPGFKGWLLLLVIGITFAPLRLLLESVLYQQDPDTQRAWTIIPDVMMTEFISSIILISSATVLAIITYRKSNWFRAAFHMSISIHIVLPWINLLVAYLLMERRGMDGSAIFAIPDREIARTVAATAIGLIWALYVARSRRVSVTFTRSSERPRAACPASPRTRPPVPPDGPPPSA